MNARPALTGVGSGNGPTPCSRRPAEAKAKHAGNAFRRTLGSVDLPVADYVAALAAPTTALRVGILRAYFWEGLHPDIGAATETALSVVKRLARTQRDVGPLDGDATYSSVMTPYTASLSAEAYAYHKDSLARSPELYQAATLTRIRAGANVTLPE